MKKNISIIGAGLVGSLLSIYLAKRNYKVQVFERNSDLRKAESFGGRSINLALSDRGWKALEGVGIADEIRKMAIPMYARLIHDKKGNRTKIPYGKEDQAIYSVSRGGLNAQLMNLADDHKNVELNFNKKCTKVDLDAGKAIFLDDFRNEKLEIQNDLLFGTDGAFSVVRAAMQRKSRFDYSQDYLPHGYKELNIPPDENGNFALEKNALHIWPRGDFMMIALPNLDGSFTCTLFLAFEGKKAFENLDTKAKLLAFFENEFPDALPLMPTLVEDFFNNPTPPLVTIRCFPWKYKSNICLLGDASHAIVPFYGQGMNSGFEDCWVFNEMMDKHGENWEELLSEFQDLRFPDAQAIADLAKYNFIEMRDLSGQKRFQLRKKLEKLIQEKYPQKWKPLYEMVTFSPNLRYSEAQAIGKIQDQIMNQIMEQNQVKVFWENKKTWNDEETLKEAQEVWEMPTIQEIIEQNIKQYFN